MSEQETHKTIVFSFDGNGNEPSDVAGFTKDESISNVLKKEGVECWSVGEIDSDAA